MKAMTKSELAQRAGISLNTFSRWCKTLEPQMRQMGLPPGARVLPPNIVRLIAEHFCIDID